MKERKTVPICHGLKEHASATLDAPTTRLSGRAQHGQHVIPIHTDRVNSVACAACRNPIAKILFRGRRGDGKAIVTSDEKGRGRNGRRK
jgi:hypothetical protein